MPVRKHILNLISSLFPKLDTNLVTGAPNFIHLGDDAAIWANQDADCVTGFIWGALHLFGDCINDNSKRYWAYQATESKYTRGA